MPNDEPSLLLLDTHVLIWWARGGSELGAQTRKRIDAAYARGKASISAISFWEIATLVRKERMNLDLEPGVWCEELDRNGLIELPVTGKIAALAGGLTAIHADPADRIFAATAILHSATLLTADRLLLSTSVQFSRDDARR